MKVLSNSRFLPIPLDKNKERDARLGKKGIKAEVIFSKNALLIVLPYWPTLCLLKTDVGVRGKDHIRKSKGYDANTANRDKKVDNLGTSTADGDREADNLGTYTIDENGRANNLGTSIVDGNQEIDNPSIGITNKNGGVDNSSITIANINADRGAKDPSTGIADTDGVNDLGIDADKGADGQVAISNKACTSFFFL